MSYELDLKLPSNGLPYDGAVEPDVVIRNMTTAEQKKLLGSMSSDTVLDRIVESCVVKPKGLKVADLIPADSDFLLMKLRIHTYGSEYEIMVPKCSCGHPAHKMVFNLDDLSVNELEPDYGNNLSFELPVSKDNLVIRLITDKEIKACSDRAKKTSRRNPNIDPDELSYILRLCKTIVSVNGEELDPPTLQSYVDKMHARDVSYIWHQIGKVKIGYDKMVELECPECGEVMKFNLPMGANFFRAYFED